jgi:hypothetical protein
VGKLIFKRCLLFFHSESSVYFNKSILALIISVLIPCLVSALPEELEIFTDFEDLSGEGEFFIGEVPNRVKLVGFTIETLEDPSLLHSGTKAITLGPGQEGKIVAERGGFQLIQFYAGESTGAGKIEFRGKIYIDLDDLILTSVADNGIVENLSTDISPGADPPLYSFVSDSNSFLDTTDFDFLNGIEEMKVFNVSGKFSLDDLGITLTDRPVNNTVFTTFDELSGGDGIAAPIIVGESPFSATLTGGFIFDGGRTIFAYNIQNGETATISFETPVFEVDFFGGTIVTSSSSDPDSSVEVYDTNDNLLATFSDFEADLSPDFKPNFITINAVELGAPGGISRLVLIDDPDVNPLFSRTRIDDLGFTPIGAPGTDTSAPPPADAPSITTQPVSQEVQSGASINLSVAASGDDLTYQWYTGNSGDAANPVTGATISNLTSGALTVSTNFWVQVTNAEGTANSDTAVITIAAPAVPLVLDGAGDIAGENIQHPNGNVFDQILLTGNSIQLQARPGQITRVSFMDEDEDIVQVEYSGNGTFTITLDPATFLPPDTPPRYNQAVEYVTGRPSVVIDGADANTFFSIFTVGRINAVNQALFPEGQVYDAQADVTLVEVVNSTGIGGMQLSNTVFSGSTGKVGVDARGVPIAVRLTVGDIDASGDALPHLLFGEGSFTVPAGNPGLRITGGDLAQTNGASIVVAESGSMTRGFDRLITQNNFKSDNTPQPTQSIDAAFANEDGNAITIEVDEITIE